MFHLHFICTYFFMYIALIRVISFSGVPNWFLKKFHNGSRWSLSECLFVFQRIIGIDLISTLLCCVMFLSMYVCSVVSLPFLKPVYSSLKGISSFSTILLMIIFQLYVLLLPLMLFLSSYHITLYLLFLESELSTICPIL